MRILIGIEYLGTAYCGWQKQKNGISVQETLTEALSALTQENITLHASGRTDAGVHAICQTAHFDTQTVIPVDKLPYAVNKMLPNDIAIKHAKAVREDFHARFDAISKTYVYKIYLCPHKSPIREHTHCHIPCPLDITAMQDAAKIIVGEHDFKCFQNAGGNIKDTVRKIYGLQVASVEDEIHIEVSGNGFLYNMVRIIAGTLVYAGRGKLSIEDIKDALINKDRTKAGKTLEAKGLYLKCVEYADTQLDL